MIEIWPVSAPLDTSLAGILQFQFTFPCFLCKSYSTLDCVTKCSEAPVYRVPFSGGDGYIRNGVPGSASSFHCIERGLDES